LSHRLPVKNREVYHILELSVTCPWIWPCVWPQNSGVNPSFIGQSKMNPNTGSLALTFDVGLIWGRQQGIWGELCQHTLVSSKMSLPVLRCHTEAASVLLSRKCLAEHCSERCSRRHLGSKTCQAKENASSVTENVTTTKAMCFVVEQTVYRSNQWNVLVQRQGVHLGHFRTGRGC
jgi:hypothetical protein